MDEELSDLEQQILADGWTPAGLEWLTGVFDHLPGETDDADRLLIAKAMAAPWDALAGTSDGANPVLYFEPSPAAQDEEQERDSGEDENDHDERVGEFHPDHLPGHIAPLFAAEDT